MACDRCRKSKVKCSGPPKCVSCEKLGETCIYSYQPSRLSLQPPLLRQAEENGHAQQKPLATSAHLQSLLAVGIFTEEDLQQFLDSLPSSSTPSEDISLKQVPDSVQDSNPLVIQSSEAAVNYNTVTPGEDEFPYTALEEWGCAEAPLSITSPPQAGDVSVLGTTPQEAELWPVQGPSASPSLQDWSTEEHFKATMAFELNNDQDSSATELFEVSNRTSDCFPASFTNFAPTVILQDIVVQSHIAFAMKNKTPLAGARLLRSRARKEASMIAINAFQLGGVEVYVQDGCSIFDRLVSLFFEKFHSQHPIFWRQGFDSYSISPILVLGIATIGGIYAGGRALQYILKLHAQLRQLFADLCVRGADDLFVILFGFLVMSTDLCLGQEKAILRAREMNSLLVQRARASGLFDLHLRSRLSFGSCLSDIGGCQGDLKPWVEDEMKKRLLLGIVQADTFLSRRFGISPLVMRAEVDIELPCADLVWGYIGHDWRHKILEASLDSRLPLQSGL